MSPLVMGRRCPQVFFLTSFMVNYMQNLRVESIERKNGIFFLTYICEILLLSQILMRVN